MICRWRLTILENIKDNLKAAMKSGDSVSRDTYRMLISEVNNTKINIGHELSDEEILKVFKKESRKRKEAIIEFDKAGRVELANKEKDELKIINSFLPKELTDEVIKQHILEVLDEGFEKNMSEFGKIMKPLMNKIDGNADGNRVSSLLKDFLS